ncbi:hypothetical protein Tco_0067401 [Tanacetum coccineum]
MRTKRLLRFEIGESSAVVVARQPGSCVACRADYSFVDTVDANIRAVEERAIAAVGVVNLRVSYQENDADDHATRAMMRILVLDDRAHIDTLEDTDSSA